MNQKKLITILATITIIAILSVSLFFALFDVSATTYNTDNMTVEGVLASDSYVLFPFAKKNLKIGFSKYGEMVDYNTKTGLAYGGYDAFAPPAGVVEWQWVEGWIISITYVQGGYYKTAWAMATYSDYYDSAGIGGPWHENVTAGPLSTAVRGGRKTSGGAVTDPIKVLYDGPRRFVALLNTTIYAEPAHSTPLVTVTFTIVFDKVKKQVIILKDIKRVDVGKNIGEMQIEFGDRGQWDLGAGSPPKSYAHIFENQSTVYNDDYQSWYNTAVGSYNGTYDVCQIIDDDLAYVGWAAFWPKPIVTWVGATQEEASRDFILVSTSTKTEAYNLTAAKQNFTLVETPADYPQKNATGIFWIEDPMVFRNDVHMVINGSDPSKMVYYYRETNNVTFPTGYIPGAGDTVKIVYKRLMPHTDMSAEPNSPFVIGEWAFKMYEALEMFRGVTVYGITDLNDGDDANRAGGSNVLDAEVQYYLNETFNPYDLYSAVHKQESRWLYYDDSLAAATSYITLTEGLDDQIYYVNATSELTKLGWTAPGWTGYYFRNNTAYAYGEWVNEFEDGIDAHSKNWCALMNATYRQASQEIMLKITPTGYGPLGGLRFSDLVDFSFWYKTLYSSGNVTNQAPRIEIKLYNQSNGVFYLTLESQFNYNATGNWQQYTLNNIGWYMNGTHTADDAFYPVVGGTIVNDCDGASISYGEFYGSTGNHSYEYWNKRFRNFYVAFVAVDMWNGTAYVDDVDIGYLDKSSGIRYQRVYNMEEDKLIPSDWDAYCSFPERVLLNGTLIERYGYANLTAHEPYYSINFETGLITFYHWSSTSLYHAWNLGIGTHIKVLYSTIEENEKGRYEWIVVGKNAATIDSAATGYITQAFDSTKDIKVLMAGMDMNETTYGPYAPFVMGRATTCTRTDYVDSLGRSFLRDDWCQTIPISSSNMIFMAGPRANLGTEYFNEFTNVFFAESEWVVNNTGQANKLLALTCWDRNIYGNGYAVISVYKDLNGTIGLLFSGYQGQDFYYACKWFWDYPAGILTPDGTTVYSGIEYLQHENLGVTDIVLKITYTDPTHPTVTIVSGERLGTISEKGQHDCPYSWWQK